MAKELWVVNASETGELSREFESLTRKAQQLTEGTDLKLCAVFLGTRARERSGCSMVWFDKIYCIETKEAEKQGTAGYTTTIEALYKKYEPEYLLFTTDRISNVVSASLGIRLRAGVIAHSNDLRIENGTLICSIPTYGGQAIGDISSKTEPQIATAKVPTAVPEEREIPAMIKIEQFVPDEKCSLRLKSLDRKIDDSVNIEGADVIVCAGFGIKNKENWRKIKTLAKRLGGEAACSRSALRIADVPEEQYLIGVSGKTVAPKAYIGFGISGSTQHTCGMKNSKLVINVNNMAENTFFETSDYGFVCDAGEVLDSLLKQTE